MNNNTNISNGAKKYILIIVIVVIIIITAVLGLIYYLRVEPENLPNNEEEQVLAPIFYADEEWGFEFSYPADWETRSLFQREGMTTFGIDSPVEDKSGGPAASFIVLAFNPGEEAVFNTEMERSIKDLEDTGILASQSQRTIAGFSAIELLYADDPENPTTEQLHYFIDGGDTWYQLLYAVKKEKFDEYLSEIEKMIESFKITK